MMYTKAVIWSSIFIPKKVKIIVTILRIIYAILAIDLLEIGYRPSYLFIEIIISIKS